MAINNGTGKQRNSEAPICSDWLLEPVLCPLAPVCSHTAQAPMNHAKTKR